MKQISTVACCAPGAPPLKPRPFSWVELCRAAARQAGAAPGSATSLKVEVEPGAELFVGDPDLIERVLVNLLTNALRLSPEAVEVQVGTDGDAAALVTIADRGPGVAEDMRGAIFDKFATVAARRQGRLSHHGLGLAFCKIAVEAHGGRIWVEPGSGGGSRFHFTLPLDPGGA